MLQWLKIHMYKEGNQTVVCTECNICDNCACAKHKISQYKGHICIFVGYFLTVFANIYHLTDDMCVIK